MSTRNKLLESIVLALGGTVTNPNNRNQLLEDWLNAVSGPVKRQAPKFNGVSQYGVLPSINLSSGEVFKLTFIGSPDYAGGIRLLCDASSEASNRLVIYLSGDNPTLFRHNGGSGNVTVNGVVFDDGTAIDMDGSVYSVEYTVVSTRLVERVGARWNGTGFVNLAVYNVSVNNGSVYNFPMDDGWANNPSMRNTGSGADGTFVNMTEAAWVEISE